MRILLVSYYYPPPEGIGGLRPWRMAHHLRESGHPVDVLTATHEGDSCEAGELRIYDPSLNGCRGRFHGLAWGAHRLGVEIWNSLGHSRSVFSAWEGRACRKGAEWIRRNPPDLVLATYPPAESLTVGLHLARQAGCPLVADFRDGLNFEPVEQVQPWRFPAIRRRYHALEEKVVRESSGILAAHPGLADYLREKRGKGPVLWLPNGFDLQAGPTPRPAVMGNGVHLVHAGRFGLSDRGCDPAPLARAMQGLSDEGSPLVLHLLGKLSRREERLFRTSARRGDAIIHGEVKRSESLAWQQHAHGLLLLVSRDRPSVIPGKLLEYLPAAAPILALAPDGAAADIVGESGRGWVANPEDSPAVRNLLLRLVNRKEHDLRRNNTYIAAFNVSRQMERLEGWLGKILEEGEG